MTDTNMMGASICKCGNESHKVASAKNAALVESGEEPTETEMKPIVGCEFNICENHQIKPKGQRLPSCFIG
jgi:DNA polymerase-3 subunit alpha